MSDAIASPETSPATAGTRAPAAAWASISDLDPELWDAMEAERHRQADKIELIASENYVYAAVLEAQGSWLTNKYAEGLPGKRYYGGCEYVDIAENLARDRALALFPGADHVNVQPHSGAQANMAAYFAVLQPGDRILGMNLAHGGHLTHGSPVNFSGRLYEVHAYGVTRDEERIDYDALAAQAEEVRPKVVVAGASAYSRTWDFERMAAIAHGVGALLFVDMAHIAGLVAAGLHPSPFPHADLVTTTTHKTLRGPRGGVVFARADLPDGVDRADFPALGKSTLAQAIDKSVFPGVQGGPLMHVVAAKAVGFKLAASGEFRRDQARTIENARVLAQTLGDAGDAARQRRDRQPPRAGRRDAAGRHRPRGGGAARRRRHHRQQERDPVRRQSAQHRLGDPGRDAGHDDPRHGPGGDDADRALDRRRDPGPRRRGRPRPDPRRGARAGRPVPRPRPAAGRRLITPCE